MSADYLQIKDADLSGMTKEMNDHSLKNKKKKRKRSKNYSNINTEKERLEYLHFRDDIMSRTIVIR